MKIYLKQTCSLFDYVHIIEIDHYKAADKLANNGGAAIKIEYKRQSIVLPWSNILAIEVKG